MFASEFDDLTEILDRSVRASRGEQRLRAVLPHHSLPGRSSALRHESVVLPDGAEVITEVAFAVCHQCSHAQAMRESFEVLEGALRVPGPQQLDGGSQRIPCHAVTELHEVSNCWSKVSAPNDPARSAVDVACHRNTVERILRNRASTIRARPVGDRSADGRA